MSAPYKTCLIIFFAEIVKGGWTDFFIQAIFVGFFYGWTEKIAHKSMKW
jgi:hypothetical protein